MFTYLIVSDPGIKCEQYGKIAGKFKADQGFYFKVGAEFYHATKICMRAKASEQSGVFFIV
jgi:hypothetical protein